MKTQDTHPSETDIVLFAELRMAADRRSMLESHFARCERCSSTLAVVAQVQSFGQENSPPLDESVARRAYEMGRRTALGLEHHGILRLTRLRLVVATGVVAAAAVLFLTPPADEVDRFRDPGSLDKITLTSPEDGLSVGKTALDFSWTSVGGADRYRVTVFAESGSPLASEVTSDTRYSPDATFDLEPGRRYLWRVEALFPDGTTVESRINVFTVSP